MAIKELAKVRIIKFVIDPTPSFCLILLDMGL